ncbi:transcriptional regulator BadM/Rrf2 [Acetobacter pasteurianus subsp. pasteurianus LMG 1262 = NBRC 106471]|nr:transcriptional regulator BadM/Rrf2 [Acetobacter pasteurianus subsp. pasteurianus LMG 1262 = NBRC 106471]
MIHRLGKGGFIETLRGRNGGIRLGRLAETIRIGAVVSYMEEDMSLLDCLSHKTCEREGTCILMPSCRLRGVLSETMQAMMSVLDRYTLADMITPFECERLIRNETKD